MKIKSLTKRQVLSIKSFLRFWYSTTKNGEEIVKLRNMPFCKFQRPSSLIGPYINFRNLRLNKGSLDLAITKIPIGEIPFEGEQKFRFDGANTESRKKKSTQADLNSTHENKNNKSIG